MTQRELAHKAKLSRMHIIRIEADRISPTLDTLERIAKALRVPVVSLLTQ